MTYNLINSVKGGCGKTTFAIWLAAYLNKPTKDNDYSSALLIDMDLLGTSMPVVFYGNPDVVHNAFTNETFKNSNAKARFINKILLADGTKINAIFSSMDYSEKNKFKSGRMGGYTPVVRHSMFRSGMKKLIRNHQSIDGEEIKHFIFDMPPNSDGFSDAAMECVFDKKYSMAKKGDRKNLFMMIGSDWGQTIAAIAELKSVLFSDEIVPDRIFIVFNHNLAGDFTDTCYDIRKKKIETEIKAMGLRQREYENIYFLKMEKIDKYTTLLIGQDYSNWGLVNVPGKEINDAFPKAIIKELARCDEEFEPVASYKISDGESYSPYVQDTLWKLIVGGKNER